MEILDANSGLGEAGQRLLRAAADAAISSAHLAFGLGDDLALVNWSAMLSKLLFACLLGACAAFVPTTKLPGSRVARAAVSAPPQMGIGGVNGALDFGNLASGVGGEGTGIALGANEPALLAILLAIPFIIGTLFNGWQGYQDDDDDFFDTYDSRREDREITNRNRV